MDKKQDSSWQEVANWYDDQTGKMGHYYHTELIFPKLLPLMGLTAESKVLDIGCGQGVFSRHLPSNLRYLGVDLSKELIKSAENRRVRRTDQFFVKDATEPFELPEKNCTHAVILLALQNMKEPLAVLKNSARHLQKGGKLFIVLNHPLLRIPRQTSWQIDEKKKIQYRRLDRYMSPLTIPIAMHPGQDKSKETVSFHYPLSTYVQLLKESGFCLVDMHEWCSPKTSAGSKAKMENRAREEFPLFLTLVAQKIDF
jgi:ubiquinone/menaquinone biosynthesis C-methylase UbiE